MNYFLAKSEPSTYSIEDLERDGKTTWDGVSNPQAVIFLKQMQAGDRAFIYHSGGVSAIVGLASLMSRGRTPSETNSEHDFGEPRGPVSSIDATAAALLNYEVLLQDQAANSQQPHVPYGQQPEEPTAEEAKWFWKASYQIVAIYEGGGPSARPISTSKRR